MGNSSSVLKIAAGVALGLAVFFGLVMCSGILFTGAVLSAADEAAEQSLARQRERIADRQRERQAAETARKERELQVVEARARSSAAKAAREEQERNAVLAAARRDDKEGEFYSAASDAMPVGTFACKDRVLSVRTAAGWRATVMGDGSDAKCRTER